MDSAGELGLEKKISDVRSESIKTSPARHGAMFARLSEVTKAGLSGLVNWSRKSSVWPLGFELACCSPEMFDLSAYRIDAERAGYLPFRSTPRQSDVMVVAGWVTKAAVPEIRTMYEQMLKPKYVIAYGECAVCGGPWWESYNIVKGIDQIIPVDVYVAGCPPRPEDLFKAFMMLQKRIGGDIEG